MYDTSSPWKVFPNRHYREGIYLLNCRCYSCSKVTGTMLQQSLAWLFDSDWHDSSTVSGTIVQQSLAQLCNSGWYDYSTVTGTILQQWLARFFSFFYTGIILQQWCSLLKNRVMYQEFDRWSLDFILEIDSIRMSWLNAFWRI